MDKVALRNDGKYHASVDARWNVCLRTPLVKFWWRWGIESKPETALDFRITPTRWFRMFYFRHRPKWWYLHSGERPGGCGWGTRRGRVIFDWPCVYQEE